MTEIKRYEMSHRGLPSADYTGTWVLHEDHAAIVSAKDASITALRDELDAAERERDELRSDIELGMRLIKRMERQVLDYQAEIARRDAAAGVSFYRDGVVAAANYIDQQREAFDNEHGQRDPDTGSFEFGNLAAQEHSDTLAELAEGVRTLHDAAPVVRGNEHE